MEDMDTDESPKVRKRRIFRQLCKVMQASLGTIMIGTLFTFPSVMTADLEESDTTIYGTHISLQGHDDMIGSLVMLGSLPGAWVTASVALRWRRRKSMIVLGVLAILGWLGVALLPSVIGILISRCVSGVAMGGLAVVLSAYTAELADDQVRGTMSMVLNLGIMKGQLLTVCIGYGARYFVVALVLAIIPTLFLVALIWLPESPALLVLKGEDEKAANILLKLRGKHADLQAEMQTYKDMNHAKEEGPKWRGLIQKEVFRSLAIICSLMVINTFSGYMVLNANASRIFEGAGSTVNSELCTILIMVVQFFAGMAGSLLMDRIGRKNILYMGFFLMSTGLVALSIFVGVTQRHPGRSYKEDMSLLMESVTAPAPVVIPGGWLPLACMMVAQSGVALGVNLMPFILAQEYFPTVIRSQASSICYTVWTLGNFAVLQLYTPMLNTLDQSGLYGLYASVSALGIVFTALFVRETMGEKVG
ncbi:facilitated trehalose transporter Tret1 [Procambarus clarkii]|uniref:facilitated trehalose transporter Tret1 n=1 Tax=Procambarus clarkii TaxID=6728 RepID=UPI00374343D1